MHPIRKPTRKQMVRKKQRNVGVIIADLIAGTRPELAILTIQKSILLKFKCANHLYDIKTVYDLTAIQISGFILNENHFSYLLQFFVFTLSILVFGVIFVVLRRFQNIGLAVDNNFQF